MCSASWHESCTLCCRATLVMRACAGFQRVCVRCCVCAAWPARTAAPMPAWNELFPGSGPAMGTSGNACAGRVTDASRTRSAVPWPLPRRDAAPSCRGCCRGGRGRESGRSRAAPPPRCGQGPPAFKCALDERKPGAVPWRLEVEAVEAWREDERVEQRRDDQEREERAEHARVPVRDGADARSHALPTRKLLVAVLVVHLPFPRAQGSVRDAAKEDQVEEEAERHQPVRQKVDQYARALRAAERLLSRRVAEVRTSRWGLGHGRGRKEEGWPSLGHLHIAL